MEMKKWTIWANVFAYSLKRELERKHKCLLVLIFIIRMVYIVFVLSLHEYTLFHLSLSLWIMF